MTVSRRGNGIAYDPPPPFDGDWFQWRGQITTDVEHIKETQTKHGELLEKIVANTNRQEGAQAATEQQRTGWRANWQLLVATVAGIGGFTLAVVCAVTGV